MGVGHPNLLHAQRSTARLRIAGLTFSAHHSNTVLRWFMFGLVLDSWDPFGWRDPNYFRIFVPLTVIALAEGSISRTTCTGLVLGMLVFGPSIFGLSPRAGFLYCVGVSP